VDEKLGAVVSSRAERVLVVDDEPSIVDAVATALRYEGFTVDEALNGRRALALAQESPPDLIVLDVMLPDLSGFDIANRLRADGIGAPVLFLTARANLADKVEGLTVGDDYLTKPFQLAELVARVKAVLRRGRQLSPASGSVLSFEDVVLDEGAHTVTRDGIELRLTATEFRLLRMFLLNPNRVLSKSQILDHVWHYDFDGDASIVETYVRYLRRKLEAHGPPLIETIRLVGYVLRPAKSS
jgi:two-component system OmpR family response regulator